jgi:hypothetical protein
MFLRVKVRVKDGKEHRYWSIVENHRISDRRVVQRHVLAQTSGNQPTDARPRSTPDEIRRGQKGSGPRRQRGGSDAALAARAGQSADFSVSPVQRQAAQGSSPRRAIPAAIDLRSEDPATLWKYYILLTEIEQAFKTLKMDLSLRPVHHQKDERIEAHIFGSFLAYCLQVTLQQRLKSAGPGPDGALDPGEV